MIQTFLSFLTCRIEFQFFFSFKRFGGFERASRSVKNVLARWRPHTDWSAGALSSSSSYFHPLTKFAGLWFLMIFLGDFFLSCMVELSMGNNGRKFLPPSLVQLKQIFTRVNDLNVKARVGVFRDFGGPSDSKLVLCCSMVDLEKGVWVFFYFLMGSWSVIDLRYVFVRRVKLGVVFFFVSFLEIIYIFCWLFWGCFTIVALIGVCCGLDVRSWNFGEILYWSVFWSDGWFGRKWDFTEILGFWVKRKGLVTLGGHLEG